MCHKYGLRFEEVSEKYGILQNWMDKFRGEEIAILYDPGMFPALLKDPNGKQYIHIYIYTHSRTYTSAYCSVKMVKSEGRGKETSLKLWFRERGGEKRRCPATGQSDQASPSVSWPLDQSDPGQMVSRRWGDRFRKLAADLPTELGLPPTLQETLRGLGTPRASVLGQSDGRAGSEAKIREIRATFYGGDVESCQTDETVGQLGILRLPLLLQPDAESTERPMRRRHRSRKRQVRNQKLLFLSLIAPD